MLTENPVFVPESGVTCSTSGRKSEPVKLEISRAKPRTLAQSGRLGVRSTSMTASASCRACRSDSPTASFSSSSMMPLWSTDRPSSRAEQSMPADSTPRTLAFLILVPSGSCTPGQASADTIPARTLGAPQTTWICSEPVSTWHKVSLSASGCLATDTTLAVMMASSPTNSSSTLSTSRPSMVSRSASCAGLKSFVEVNCSSQLTVHFMSSTCAHH